MGKSRWMTGSLVGLALLVSSITPAQARPRYDRGHDRGWGHHHRDRGNGFGFGDAVGVVALIGAVAIVASSMSKDKKAARNSDGTAPPPASGTDYGADVRSDDDFSDVAATHGDQDQMTDACAVAARDEAQGQNGGYAEVRRMDEPRAAQDGYNIDGEVESRASYRAATGTTRRFTCTIKDGRVAQVYLSRDVVMR
ncbi:hypothetical protein EBBID32_44830 [Sphingobium indicum BiD32]|uniref:Secreted protein n=1 Tax=Sphingobium indicum BiD32 TaxID=1301087 RepID=N1MX50_9SPHN|nr:hypothetical protein [Sphingobium indicum]CCW20112.1 hypothetical protein EBBID32_44830 [Sphingobium indicum BiD32]